LLSRSAQPKPEFLSASDNLMIDIGREAMGGLWVGGVLYVHDDGFRFEANSFNRLLQNGVDPVCVGFDRVAAVRWRRALITSIVEVETLGGPPISFRCWGSRGLAATLERAVMDYHARVDALAK